MTNFDFLKSKRTFDSFADAAIAAERISAKTYATLSSIFLS